MHAIDIMANLKRRLSRIVRREEGSSIIELAIIFPILLLLFVGIAELGRLFYTYTTLAKATKVGARYLSTSRNAVNGTAAQITAAKEEARSLVVCGFPDCTNQPPIVPGLTTANVNVCDSISVPCAPSLAGGPIRYFRVEIKNYTYSPGVFNLAGVTGAASSAIYFSLTPGTEMRYVPD